MTVAIERNEKNNGAEKTTKDIRFIFNSIHQEIQ